MEIRFRVWDGEKMWYPEDNDHYAVTSGGRTLKYLSDKWGSRYTDVPFVAMLSTGLKDAFGKEIWEGDICQVNKDHGFICTIAWSDNLATFALRNISDKTDRAGSWWVDSELEIIGNAHENPELLKEVA